MPLKIPTVSFTKRDDFSPASDWLGWVYFGLMMIFSIVYFKERIAFMDTSGYLYSIICDDTFRLPHRRYGAFITQLIPLLFVKMALPLKAVVMGYSLNFWLVNFLAWIFCRYVARSREAALMIVLYNAFLVIVLHFWPVSELFQGGHYVIMLYAWLGIPKSFPLVPKYLILISISTLVVFTHPIIGIPVAFILAFIFLSRKPQHRKAFLFDAGVVISIFILHKIIMPAQPYDANRTDVIFRIHELLTNFSEIKSVNLFKLYTQRQFMPLVYLLGGMCVFYLFTFKLGKLLLIVGFSVAYSLLVIVAYSQGDSELIFENLLRPLSLAAVICFVSDLLRKINYTHLPALILTGIIIHSFSLSSSLRPKLKQRSQWYQEVFPELRKFPERKFIMHSKNLPLRRINFSWANSYESLLHSSLNSPDSALVLCATNEPNVYMAKKGQEKVIPRVPFHKFDRLAHLPPNYFNVPASNFRYLHEYSLSTGDSLLKEFTQNISIHFPDLQPEYAANEELMLKANLKNTASIPLPSRIEQKYPVGFGYKFYSTDPRKLIFEKGKDNPLLMDVESELTQPVFIRIPKRHKGLVELEIDLFYEADSIYSIASVKFPLKISPK